MRFIALITLLFHSFSIIKGQNQAIETIVQAGHHAAILGAAFSPDGKLIATAGRDNSIILWEASSGRELRTFSGHNRAVRSVQFSPDGEKLLTVGLDHKAFVWEVVTGKIAGILVDSTDEIRSAVFSPSGTYILTGGHKTNAILWNAEELTRIAVMNARPEVCYQCASSMVFSPDERYIYTSSGDRTTLVWKTGREDTLRSFSFTPGSCSSCNTCQDIDPSGIYLAKADYSGGLYIVELSTGRIKRQLAEKESFRAVSFHPSGKYIVTLSEYNGKVAVWDINTGKRTLEIDAHEGINAISLSPDGNRLLTAGEDGEAAVWNFSTGMKITSFKGMVTRVTEKGLSDDELYFINLLKDTELSPDGKLVAQCQRGHAAVLWDFQTGRILKKLIGHVSVVTCIGFSPDGKIIATGSADRTIKLWNTEDAKLLRSIDAHNAMILSVQFSNDGQQIISGSWDGTFRVWDVNTGKMIVAGRVHEGSPYAVALTHNNIYAISAGLDKSLKLTELDSRAEVRQYIGHTDVVHSIAFSNDGNTMATAGWDGYTRLWDVKSGWQLKKISGHDNKVYDASFDSSGKLLVTGGEDKTARLWNLETGELQMTFTGHTGGVNYVKITPDGKHLLTAGRDRTVKIWDIENGRELVTQVTLNENDWMAKTRDGYFEGTPAATKSLYFVKGTRSYSLDQFFQQFYKPGIYREAITVNDRSVPSNNVLTALENSPPPVIEILAPENGLTVKNNHLEIILKVTNAGGGIKEIRLHHNEKRLEIPDQLSRTPKAGQDMVLTYSVVLIPGENKISISGISDGQVESKPVVCNVHYTGTEKAANLYVFAVGINEYQNPALTLNYARSDAESFAEIVNRKSRKLFKKVEVTVILDREATRDNILNTLETLKNKITKEDVFYFYYAGHGGTFNDEFYFIPTESVSLYQGDKLNEQAIPAGMINEKLKSIAALKQVIVLDACHSGASTQVLATRGLSQEKALAQLARSAGIHIMAAAGSEQQAVEFGQLGHGVFTYALIEALEGKADGAPADNKVTIFELKSYLDDQVPELTRKFQGSSQYPSTFSLGQDFPMALEE